jgi:hypothetical protein
MFFVDFPIFSTLGTVVIIYLFCFISSTNTFPVLNKMTSKTESIVTATCLDEKMEAELLEALRTASSSRSVYRMLTRTILKDLERRESWQRRVKNCLHLTKIHFWQLFLYLHFKLFWKIVIGTWVSYAVFILENLCKQ